MMRLIRLNKIDKTYLRCFFILGDFVKNLLLVHMLKSVWTSGFWKPLIHTQSFGIYFLSIFMSRI